MKEYESKQDRWDDTYLDICERIQENSKGAKYRVGAMLVRDMRPLVNGYNGTPPGYPNGTDLFSLEEVWCDPEEKQRHRDWSAKFEVHAEMNALLYASRNGIRVEGSTLYCTLQPCHNCLKHAICSGVVRIVYRYNHPRIDYDQDTLEMLKHCGVELVHQGIEDQGLCRTVDLEKDC